MAQYVMSMLRVSKIVPPKRQIIKDISLSFFPGASGSDSSHQMENAADALRLPEWDAVIKNLSGKEKRRVALCKLLLEKPDMPLLDNATELMLALDRGHGIPWKGSYSSWLEQKEARLGCFEKLSSMEYQKRNETQEIFIPADELVEARNRKGFATLRWVPSWRY